MYVRTAEWLDTQITYGALFVSKLTVDSIDRNQGDRFTIDPIWKSYLGDRFTIDPIRQNVTRRSIYNRPDLETLYRRSIYNRPDLEKLSRR